jgi:hypothetical protein
MIAMISHNGRCCIGINSDRAAVTEPELLIECLREGLDEVLALAKAAASPRPAPAPKRTAAGARKRPRSRKSTTRPLEGKS